MDLFTRADDQAGKTGGSNYFFGFLIAFIALISMFVGCGLGQRRWRRRMMAGADMDDWALTYEEQAQAAALANKLPKFWEPWTDIPVEGTLAWQSLLPLSAYLTRKERPVMARLPSRTTPFASSNRQALNGLSLPRWTEQETPATPEPAPSPPKITGLEMTFLIAMPRPSAAAEKDDENGRLGEYEIGSIRVPWASEVIS